MKIIYFSFLIILLVFTGCGAFCNRTPRAVKKAFSYEEINGFSGVYKYKLHNDTTGSQKYYVFFNDGTFVSGLYDINYENLNLEDIHKLLSKKENDLNRRFWWGYYSLENNTLQLKRIENKLYPCDPWPANYYEYEKINEKFKCVSSKDIAPFKERDKSYEDYLDRNPSIKYHELVFVDSCDCATSETWLKYEKWFWKNEQDYLDWIEKSGGDRKKYHK